MSNQTIMQPTPEQIAVCAYLIWVKQGRPHGRHEAHWLQAEKQLRADLAHEAGLLHRPYPLLLAAPPVIKQPRSKRGNKSKRRELVAS